MLVEGNPCHIRSLNMVGFKRNKFTREQIEVLKKAYKILYKSGLTIREALAQLEPLQMYPEVRHLREFIHSSINDPNRRGLINPQRRGSKDEV